MRWLAKRCLVFSVTLTSIAAFLVPTGVYIAAPSDTQYALGTVNEVEPGAAQSIYEQPISDSTAEAPITGSSASPFGPQHTAFDQAIPKHAYSPFDQPPEPSYTPGSLDFVEGWMLIKLAPQNQVAVAGESSLHELLSAQGITDLEPVFPAAQQLQAGAALSLDNDSQPQPDLSRWYRASLASDADVLAVAQALAANPAVEVAEPDYIRRLATLPDAATDPRYAEQWHMSAIRAPEAWQFLADHGINPGGRRDVVVAVIDTGVDYTHPDLAGNMWTNTGEIPGNGIDDDHNGFVDDIHGANVVSTLKTGDPRDDQGHGTHVAGIVAAQGNNGLGGVGIAYNAQIMAIKAAQYSGVLSSSDIAEAVYYAVEKGADVINMSFGGYARSQIEEDALAVAFGQAVPVAAAGNDGKPTEIAPNKPKFPMYPAAYNWVLGVMASTQAGDRALFSSYDSFSRTSYEYELMAPGVDILSTLPGGQYAAWDGTSMAVPVVSGIAALVRSHFWDKDVYSSRFVMGQIASQGADAYEALTETPQPELSYLEHWLFDDNTTLNPLNDGDGIMDAGETMDLAIVIRNHWGKADNVEVSLRAYVPGAFQDDPYVTFDIGTVNYGAVGSFNIDDNGLIYDAEGAITGVSHPFRFTVSPETPNDHVIPFLLTMTCSNGLNPSDTTSYTFQSSFSLIVQRGRELPRIISENMTLTKDYYWLVPDQTLIEAGVTVIVEAGTQIQFWSADPADPYSQAANPSSRWREPCWSREH